MRKLLCRQFTRFVSPFETIEFETHFPMLDFLNLTREKLFRQATMHSLHIKFLLIIPLVLYRCLPTALGLDNVNSTDLKKQLEDGIK